MRSFFPLGTLILLLAAAAAILVGGGRLAGRTERIHVAGDRAPIQTAAGGMQSELARLERLYETHLNQLSKATELLGEDRLGIWQRCKGIAGVRQWSLIHPGSQAGGDVHIPIDTTRAQSLPEPAFHAGREGLPRQTVLLPGELLQPEGDASGWIDEPGKPLLFWHRVNHEAAVVLLIDPSVMLETLVPWLTKWTGDAFGPVRAAKQTVAALSPAGRAIVRVGAVPDAEPDFLLPLRSRFGHWQIAAWDRVETRTVYDAPTQAATHALALLVAMLGVFGFVQQRRTLVLAAQRASFINHVSHELRTPLTNILLNLDLATEALEGDETASGPVRRLAMVGEEAQRLSRLIENVLAFSHHERGQLRLQPRACVPETVVQGIVDQFAPSFARRGLLVQITGGSATACMLDADAFAQILANLLSNVEKYVPGGPVKIAMHLAGEMLSLTVSDEGPGIPPRAAERIFRPFERLDSRINEGASGTGLGLAIARELAKGAGGDLRLVSSLRGASFELRIPAPPAPTPRAISA